MLGVGTCALGLGFIVCLQEELLSLIYSSVDNLWYDKVQC